jgi:large subunit ribosomal protein L4
MQQKNKEIKEMPRVKKEISKKLQVTSKKTAAKAVEKPATKTAALSVPVYSLAGRTSGTLSLPKEIFGKESANNKLLAQALRVYMTNQKQHLGSTKTRGDVEGSTAKIFRQKGTGRARHGSIRAPIFVGGGIALGPKPRKVKLNLPQKMKKAALLTALSGKAADKGVLGLSGLEKATGKTKEIAGLLKKINAENALIVTGEKMDNVLRAVRNIENVDVLPANLINAYEVVRHNMLIVTKEALEKLVNPKSETK